MNTQKTKGDILAERIEKLIAALNDESHTRRVINEALAEYLKPWTLGRSVNGFTLGDGQEWHRNDFTEDMLPEGWRPLLLDESTDGKTDEARFQNAKDKFDQQRGICKAYAGSHLFWRTRRPLPPVKKMVKLGPEDVPPGSALRHPLWPAGEYIIPSCVSQEGIYTKMGDSDRVNWTWEYMQKEGVLISRDGGKSWQKCEKEEAK